jgi:hypothetical protein
MKSKISIFLVTIVLMLAIGVVQSALGAEDNRTLQKTILREKPQDLENNRFLLEVSPCYYKYKTNTPDWFNAGLLFKADVADDWEVSVGSDFISYQSPDFGLSDLFLGAKWNFYEKDGFNMALTGYVLFPTGTKAFREPGIEPTLAILLSKTLGDFEIGLSVGSTYAADADTEPNYLDLEMSLELEYTLNEKNSVGLFVSGYGPDERSGGSSRLEAGTTYTRALTRSQSLSVMLMKGFSGKGLDWSGTLFYSYTF